MWKVRTLRKITMRVLTMQLNSITVMDLVAYGGSALGIVFALTEYSTHSEPHRPALRATRSIM